MNAQSHKQGSLLAAIEKNDFKETKNLLDKYGLILDDDFSDYKLLIQALRRGNKRIAKLLLDNGCRVFCQQKTHVYNTPLYYAVNINCFDLVITLLDKGVSISGKDANKETPLIFAMKNKYFDIVDLMLSKYKVENININNDIEAEHFYIACRRDKTTLVKSFLEHGMNVNRKSFGLFGNTHGYTPLHFAAEHQSVETVKLLLSNNANFGLKNGKGLTPLHISFYFKNCKKENQEIIDLILFAHLNAMVNPVDKSCGISHFHIACTRSNLTLLDLFLKSGADLNGCIFSNSSILPGYSPLHIAVKYNCKETVKFLLNKNADVNYKSIKNGATPLHVAVENNNTEIFRLLLQFNADVCAVDDDQNTPIHTSLELLTKINCTDLKRLNIINLLLSIHQGKLENVTNKLGVGIFHLACLFDSQVVENFLKQNVDINACVKKNSKSSWAGFSALHIAIVQGNLQVFRVLLQYKDELIMTDPNGQSLLCWMCRKWFDQIIEESFALELPSNSFKNESIKTVLLQKIPIGDANRSQIFKLLLKNRTNLNVTNNETYDIDKTLIFDICEMMFNALQKIKINSKVEMNQVKLNRIYTNFKEIIITLLDHGQDINVTYNKHNKKVTVLHCVIQLLRIYYNDSIIAMIELLLIRGAQVDIEAENGVTPLMMAALEGFYEVVDILLKYGADPNRHSTPADLCMTPLHFALGSSKLDSFNAIFMIKITYSLLAKGAKVTAKNGDGNTPLHFAAQCPSLHKGLLRLLEYNCNVNSKNNNGNTALHVACINGCMTALIMLLNFGADINLVNNRKESPLQILLRSSHKMLYYRMEFYEMLKIMELHIIKLKVIGFHVSKNNNRLCKAVKSCCKKQNQLDFDSADKILNSSISNHDEDSIFIDFCRRELERMKNTKIDMYTSLHSIIFKDAHEVAKHVNNENFKEFLNSRELNEHFPLYGYILNLQYKKGLERYELLKPAEDILRTLLDLPDLCYNRILASFNNQELQELQ